MAPKPFERRRRLERRRAQLSQCNKWFEIFEHALTSRVESLIPNPVPPVVIQRVTPVWSIHFLTILWMTPGSSGTIAWTTTRKPSEGWLSKDERRNGPAVSEAGSLWAVSDTEQIERGSRMCSWTVSKPVGLERRMQRLTCQDPDRVESWMEWIESAKRSASCFSNSQKPKDRLTHTLKEDRQLRVRMTMWWKEYKRKSFRSFALFSSQRSPPLLVRFASAARPFSQRNRRDIRQSSIQARHKFRREYRKSVRRIRISVLDVFILHRQIHWLLHEPCPELKRRAKTKKEGKG